MMEFDYSANDLQDLSEWPDSLEFDEFCDPSEAREEPLAKRQKTAVDDEPQTAGHGGFYKFIQRQARKIQLPLLRFREFMSQCLEGYYSTVFVFLFVSI